MMAVCHTAVPEREGDKIIYQAASPGENQIIEWTYGKVFYQLNKQILFKVYWVFEIFLISEDIPQKELVSAKINLVKKPFRLF